MSAQTQFTSTPRSTVIGNDPPRDGRDWECQCARCGSSLDWISCEACGGEGITGPGELYEDDPLWYDVDDYEPCHQCGGQASWPSCLSGPEWCNANPLSGREAVKRDTPEWFVVEYRLGETVPNAPTASPATGASSPTSVSPVETLPKGNREAGDN